MASTGTACKFRHPKREPKKGMATAQIEESRVTRVEVLDLCFDSLDQVSVCFDFLDQLLVCFDYLEATKNCSTLFDPVQICFDFLKQSLILFDFFYYFKRLFF